MVNYVVQYGVHPTKVGQQFRVKSVEFTGETAFENSEAFFAKVKKTASRSKSPWTISLWERYPNGAPRRWLVKSETINPTGIVG